MGKRIRKRLERWLALFILKIANLLSRKRALKMGESLADFAYVVVYTFKKTALENMDIAFGDKYTKEEKLKIAKKALRCLARTMIDFVRYKQYSKEELLSYCKRVEGEEYLIKALEESPGGVIGLASHLGSWEYSGAWMVASGYKLAAVGKEQPDAEITRLMIEYRRCSGIEHIPKTRQGNKAILKTLNEKAILGLLADQNGGSTGIFVPFFNKLASTVKGPAQLAMKKKVPVMLIIALWEGYEYVIHIEPPVEMVYTGDEEADLLENTRRCQAEIEKMVKKYPDQWLWGHRRWKTRPPEELQSKYAG